MGDFFAKIGSDNRGYEEIMGKQGLGDNEERFAGLCATSNMDIEGSVFHHRRIHKATWVSPDLSSEDQIDHLSQGSFVALFRMSVSSANAITATLKDTWKQEEFKLTLSNKFQVLKELLEEETIEQKLQNVKEAATSTCQEVLGSKYNTHKEWISAKTLQKVANRQKTKASVNNSRTRAAENGSTRRPERPVRDKIGGVITEDEGKRKRWIEHFQELLNRPAPANAPGIPPAISDLSIKCCTPKKKEISSAIKRLKNGKSAGPDSIPAEALKADVEISLELLHPLFSKIWEDEKIQSGKRGNSSSFPRKATSVPAPTTDESHCCQSQDSVDRESIWRLLRHDRVPGKITNMIRKSYKGMTCRIVHDRQLTDAFELEDLDFADDLALLSHTQQQMHEKTNIVADNSARLSLTINRGKNKASRTNAYNNTPITRRWWWIGHTLHKPVSNTTMQSHVEPARKKRGRPRNTWHRDLDADAKRMDQTWSSWRYSPTTETPG
ncbi:uncharacterized protein LOC127878474 [Dreissena polymorpha]|uniref:uncharacterized protein LOC127878474 n=1 Tax=Dreissena polymorpha TaxID=45954 RepID=UPI002263EE5F|nr:uncharacterized protein LOC127878474 [Dreissena polymorpha]